MMISKVEIDNAESMLFSKLDPVDISSTSLDFVQIGEELMGSRGVASQAVLF